MDKVIDVIFDPKVILAVVVGWTLHEVVTTRGGGVGQGAAKEMAGTIVSRQVGVARQHTAKRVMSLADDRTKNLVDSFFPRAKSKADDRVIQLTVPR